MIWMSDSEVDQRLRREELIPALRDGFASNICAPARHHHTYSSGSSDPSTLLLMPAWEDGKFLGVKIVTVSPNNGLRQEPVIHGTYLLCDAVSGRPLMAADARLLTARRTAATSALASAILSREDASVLCMIGTGALAHELIPAHGVVRKIRRVMIWGRSEERAQCLAERMRTHAREIIVCQSPEEGVREADIISCATVSSTPIIEGRWLRDGQHIDLVGAYRPDMRESDDDVVARSRIFVDSRQTAPAEAGDLAIPISRGVIDASDIGADLFDLSKGQHPGRTSAEEITVFKSVGHAIEDLVAARLVYQTEAQAIRE